MPRRAIWLTAILLAACSAETPPVRAALAGDRSAETPAAAPERDLAAEARSFFLAQAELLLAGADPAADPHLSDALRAMGRDDLAGPGDGARNACPRQWVDPAELVAQSATGSRILIIESNRHAPAQTAFLETLVRRLARDGFTAFADDGLTLGPAGSGHPDVLLVSEGLVTRDPGHGRLLRTVKALDLQLVDAGIWWRSARELSELPPEVLLSQRQTALALQVSRRAFERNPDARVIIHTEQAANPNAAAAFKTAVASLTGHHPLLIALTDCASPGAAPAFLPGFGDGGGPGDAADLVFAVPQAPDIGGRRAAGQLRAERLVAVPSGFLPAGQPVLVEARRDGDPALAIPEDRLMLFPGDRLPLVLPPGDYRIEAWTRDGPLADPFAVEVT